MARVICVLVVLVLWVARSASDYVATLNEFRRLHQAKDVKKNVDMATVAQASFDSGP